MKNIYNIIFLSLIILGCEKLTYSPTDENFVEVKPPDYYVSIDLMAEADTISGWGNIELKYEVDISEHQLYKVMCFIDSSLIRTTNSLNVLSFSSRNFADGYHELVLEVWVKSGSNSLADKLGAEFVYNQIKKTIYIENEIPENGITQLNIYPFEGRLKLDWPVYERINFQSYKVLRTYFDDNTNRRSVLLGVIENPLKNWWIDSSYVGGDFEYIVQIEAANEIISGSFVAVDYKIPSITSFKGEEEHIRITWNKTEFYSNFEKYTIARYINLDVWNRYSEYASVYNVNDTSLIDTTIGFGVEVDYKIITEPGSIESEITEVYLGRKIPEFTSLQYIKPLNSIYLVYNLNNRGSGSQTHRLDATSINIEANRNGVIQVSDDGTRGYYLTADKKNLQEVDPLKLTDREIISINSLYNSDNIIYQLSVNNSQVAITRNDNGIDVIDLTDMQIIYTIPKQTDWPAYHPQLGHVANNSIHFIIASNPFIGTENNRMYNLSNGTLSYNTIGTYRSYNSCFNFSGSRYITTQNSVINIYASKGNSHLNSIAIQDASDGTMKYPNIDPYFENLLTGQVSISKNWDLEFYIDIYDLNTGQIMKRVKMPLNWRKKMRYTGGGNGIWLINKTLFSSHGYYLKLEI